MHKESKQKSEKKGADGKATVQEKSAARQARYADPAVDSIITLQRTIGNRAVGRLIGGPQVPPHNKTGLPDDLRAGLEKLSGISMDDVRVHYNSSRPATINAHAFAQGKHIYVASGQEKHLPHEGWHAVQQKQGRVKPTARIRGNVSLNDDAGLEREADVKGTEASRAGRRSLQGKPARYTGPLNTNSRMLPLAKSTIEPAFIRKESGELVTQRNGDGGGVAKNLLKGAGISLLAAVDFFDVARRIRQKLLEKEFKVKIGGGLVPFSHLMLSRIDEVLRALPKEHLTKNSKLQAIKGDQPWEFTGVAYFDEDGKEIKLGRLHIPACVYLGLDKGSDAVLSLLDRIRTSNLEGIRNTQEIEALYRDAGMVADITVMGEGQEGKLFDWQLRHEIGHSVDAEIGWTKNKEYEDSKFGGWHLFEPLGPAEIQKLSRLFLSAEHVEYDRLHGDTCDAFHGVVIKGPGAYKIPDRRWDEPRNEYEAGVGSQLKKAYGRIRIAVTHPWLDSKGGSPATLIKGRVYQKSYEGSARGVWMSYDYEARENKVSNYQFSCPSEWFAEAYAACYGPDKEKDKLDDWVIDWFENDLPEEFSTKTEKD